MDIKTALATMQELGLKLTEVAKQAGKAPSTVQKWVNGTINISENTKVDITVAAKNILNAFKEIEIEG